MKQKKTAVSSERAQMVTEAFLQITQYGTVLVKILPVFCPQFFTQYYLRTVNLRTDVT
jgi:hypothetical protein